MGAPARRDGARAPGAAQHRDLAEEVSLAQPHLGARRRQLDVDDLARRLLRRVRLAVQQQVAEADVQRGDHERGGDPEREVAARRQALRAALSRGQSPGVAIQDLRDRNTREVNTIADLAQAALNAMVARAQALAAEAEATLLAAAGQLDQLALPSPDLSDPPGTLSRREHTE